ncbi:hypothetical protein CHARACLAT_025543 [Characodon lateralis]|uniref:Uncharacterized protein n=1 Tax=Characodon lateralis TaxID=208331 RepID=A0ABU7DA11_9TELE|nr:hypothetical protein [Characodon lateralis]
MPHRPPPLLEHAPQATTRDTVKCLLQVYKTRGQFGQTTHETSSSVGEAVLSPPEVPDGLPESLQCQPVLLDGIPNFSQVRVFASATARAAARLPSRYPSAASGVPQANPSRLDSFS